MTTQRNDRTPIQTTFNRCNDGENSPDAGPCSEEPLAGEEWLQQHYREREEIEEREEELQKLSKSLLCFHIMETTIHTDILLLKCTWKFSFFWFTDICLHLLC